MAQTSLQKAGRVKVGVRCRPAFQDEIDFAKGEFISIVDTRAEAINDPSLGQLSLTLISGRQREFLYDYVFSSDATQDQVYNRIAQPVVADVLKGFNGTIFAYGQTGTGKTYTMGILEFISNEHAGIIPRAVAQIFHYYEYQQLHHPANEITISMSFLQLYRETIQDLLAPASSSSGGNNANSAGTDDNLAIREDPQRGFYVEGLQEFVVRNYQESEALINLGLENRAIAPTLMNATSSRSHTVLTINIEQRVTTDVQAANGGGTGANNGNMTPGTSSRSSSNTTLVSLNNTTTNPRKAQYTKTLRSKLLMVDLAGSERVRRTVSKGARLSEAKSINQSLSALGNVIAALAESNASHIPYRDSKLTRLLQDSLGGTARTALIATVGPAAVNYGETLSTLMFASRCMSVKTVPVQHAEVDYAELCAALQAKVNEMEGVTTERLLQQQEGYELTIRELRNQLELERSNAAQHQVAIAAHSRDAAKAAFNSELRTLLEHVEKVRTAERNYHLQQQQQRGKGRSGQQGVHSSESEQALECFLSKPVGWTIVPAGSNSKSSTVAASGSASGKGVGTSITSPPSMRPVPVDAVQAQLLGYCFEIISQLSAELTSTLHRNSEREERSKVNLADEFTAQEKVEAQRLRERAAMNSADPRNVMNRTSTGSAENNMSGLEVPKIGSHLAPMSQLDALRRVEGQYRSNNDPVTHVSTTTGADSGASGASQVGSTQQSLLKLSLTQPLSAPVTVPTRPSLFNYTSVEEVAAALTAMHSGIRENLSSIQALLARKDAHYQNVKEALTLQLMEKRKREEEVINWSYILKYLLGSASKLRQQLQQQGQRKSSTSSSAAPATAAPATSNPVINGANTSPSGGADGNNLYSVAHSAVRLPFSQLGTGILTAPAQVSLPASVPVRVPSQPSTQPTVYSRTQQQYLSSEYDDADIDNNRTASTSQRSTNNAKSTYNESTYSDVDSQDVVPPAGRSRSRSKDALSVQSSMQSTIQSSVLPSPQLSQSMSQQMSQQPSLPSQRPPSNPTALRMQAPAYQQQSQYADPASPPYSNVDDSDLSVGSTILSRSTAQDSSQQAYQQAYQQGFHQSYQQSYQQGQQGYQQPSPQYQQQQFAPQYAPAPSTNMSANTNRNGVPTGPSGRQRASSREHQREREYEHTGNQGFVTPQHGYPSAPQPSQVPPFRSSTSGSAGSGAQQTSRQNQQSSQHQHAGRAASQFAQEVVQDLGVDSSQAEAAMSVIDKVSQISDAQLAQLDPDTRQQILQIRRELGLSGGPAGAGGGVSASGSTKRSSSGGANVPNLPTQSVRNAQYYPQTAPKNASQNMPKRANSAPRQRISSASASLLSQQPAQYQNPATYSSGPHNMNYANFQQHAPRSSSGRDRERDREAAAFSPYSNPAQNLSNQWDLSPLTTASSRYPPSHNSGGYSDGSGQYQQQQRQQQGGGVVNRYDERVDQRQFVQSQQPGTGYYDPDEDDDNFSQLDML